MCGRVVGRLVGPAPTPSERTLRRGYPPRFAAFRPIDPTQPATRLNGDEQFRCHACGGGVMMDEIETFSTYLDVDDETDAEERPKRGRPPKPWRSPAGAPAWLDDLGIAG